jgi:hypothetical protein
MLPSPPSAPSSSFSPENSTSPISTHISDNLPTQISKEPKFSINANGNVSAEKCHSERTTEAEASDSDSISGSKQPLSVCVDFPEISRFPRDELEYPRPGQKKPAVGEIELLTGSHEVCKAVLEELEADFDIFDYYSNQEAIKLRRPSWSSPSVELPRELAYSRESVFDFDNDGKLDRVFGNDFESNYMDGSVLLVQRGSSSSKLSVHGSPMDKSSWYIPCQMSNTRYEIPDCPLFSQKGDEAEFSMKKRNGKDSVYFRARYSSVSPFTFQKENFIGVSSKSAGNTHAFVAVLKPMPDRTFQPMCLFEQITENF